MGNYTTRINWSPRQDTNIIQEDINIVCHKYNMHCINCTNGVNILAEDTIHNENGIVLNDMGNCVQDVEKLLNKRNIEYTSDDTKWWWDMI